MKRYSITFKDKNTKLSDVAQAINRLPDDLDDCCEFLLRSSTDRPEVPLVFPEVGVCYSELDAETHDRLSGRPEILELRETREISSKPAPSEDRILTREELAAEFQNQPIPWNISRICADRCWTKATGIGVKVGVIDSEFDRDHPDLPIVEGASFHPDAAEWWGADDDHGTSCAGIIGARNNGIGIVGVAPECDLFAMRVNKNGFGNSDYILAAMIWAARKKLDVVSVCQVYRMT